MTTLINRYLLFMESQLDAAEDRQVFGVSSDLDAVALNIGCSFVNGAVAMMVRIGRRPKEIVTAVLALADSTPNICGDLSKTIREGVESVPGVVSFYAKPNDPLNLETNLGAAQAVVSVFQGLRTDNRYAYCCGLMYERGTDERLTYEFAFIVGAVSVLTLSRTTASNEGWIITVVSSMRLFIGSEEGDYYDHLLIELLAVYRDNLIEYEQTEKHNS